MNQSKEIDLSKLSTTESIDQSVAKEAKNTLNNYSELTTILAVNTDYQLIIAFKTTQWEKLRLSDHKKEIENELKQRFPHLEIIVSTDQKIILELEKIEKALSNKQISKKDLYRRINELIRLSKDQA